MNKNNIILLYIVYFYLLSFDNCFLFSIVMAIYNTGRYLEDSIGSLLNQTIGFKKIQIILVNDGSTDKTEEICLSYQKLYPKNIISLKINHAGVSKARNEGLYYAKGKFINFLDPDDKWHYNAFKYFLLFFKYYKDIDFVTGRLKFFEADNNYHPYDYKFYKSRIVNLFYEYNCVHTSASSSIFRKSSIKDKYFEEGVFSGEDTRFVFNILLSNPIMGLIREAIYFYRRRADSTSAVQNQKQKTAFYFETLKSVTYYLMTSSKTLFNMIIPFVQFYIGYDILFRIQASAFKILDDNSYQKYCLIIEELLNVIDDKYILEQKILPNKYKIFTLSKKHKRDLRYDIIFKNGLFVYLDHIIINMKTENIIVWRILDIKNNILHIEGIDSFWLPREKYSYFCKLKGKIYFPKYIKNSNYDFITMYGIIEKGRIVTFDIPLQKSKNPQIISFYISYMDINIEIFPLLGMFSHIPPITNGYYVAENYIVKYKDKRLMLLIYRKELEINSEKLYCSELQKINKNNIILLRNKFKKHKKKIEIHKNLEIWLINDRKNEASDNGEYFFRFLKTKKPEGIKPYFIIKKNCFDFQRLKKLGNILDLESDKYRFIFLKASKIISSIPNVWIFNPFNDDKKYFRDFFNFKIIFLQTGIIKDDLSEYLNKFITQYNLFITSSKKEYLSILNSNYGYSKREVVLTGMPRYDNLQRLKSLENNNKRILIIPTWRKNIKGTMDKLTYESVYSDRFISTEFFSFYNNLINDKTLLTIMKESDYKGTLCLHPYFESQWIDFNQNEIFCVSAKCDFPKLFLESSLLVTDYSSVFFDFGYLRKPIIYAHFDYEDYRKNHFKKGYFDYNLDGFGPICKDIKCTINEIILEIKRNCVLMEKYSRRIKKFFSFSDEDNNERILKEIIKNKNNAPKNGINSFNPYFIFLSFILIIKFIKELNCFNYLNLYNQILYIE